MAINRPVVLNMYQLLFQLLVDCLGVIPGGKVLEEVQDVAALVKDLEICIRAFMSSTDGLSIAASLDPNDKEGTKGVGTSQWVSGNESLLYSVYFLNESTATAAAQSVTVSDPVDPSVDLSTFHLSGIVIGGFNVAVPQMFDPALGQYQASTAVDFRPAQSLLVNVGISLDPISRLLSAQLTSIDPTTGLPPTDSMVGVLPPGVEASISYSARPLKSLTTGTAITNQATIVFDTNPSMTTQPWINTIDNTPPKSEVVALPPIESNANFNVLWAGSDQSSGIQDYTVYMSDNSGEFVAFQTNTVATSASFSGQANHTYAFYSVARDFVGNVEGAKTAAEATTQVAPFSLSSAPATLTIASPGGNAKGTVTIPPAPGFSGTVDLSCSVSYNGQGTANEPPTCQLGSTQLNITAPDSGNTTVTVSTTAPQQATASPVGRADRAWPLGSFILLLLVPIATVRRRRAHVRALALAMVVLALLALLPSCGGGGGGERKVDGTTVGKYTISITAASGGYSTNVSVQLTVQ
jgi:hypothetical protein